MSQTLVLKIYIIFLYPEEETNMKYECGNTNVHFVSTPPTSLTEGHAY